MMNLKNKLEELDIVMRNVKKATSLEPEFCYDRMKKQSYEVGKLEEMIIRRERENKSLAKRHDHGMLIQKSLIDNVSTDVCQRRDLIAELEKKIEQAYNQQLDIDVDMRESGDIICSLRYAFQHFYDLLNHVGEEHIAERKNYPTKELELPLLQFPGRTVARKPPLPREDDVESLLKITRNRISLLMKKFNDDQVALSKASRMYHTDLIQNLTVEALKVEEVTDARIWNYVFTMFLCH